MRPHLDDKVLASWNGLMLGALARAYAVLGDETYLAAAEKNLAFLQAKLWDARTKTFYHRWRDGERDPCNCSRPTPILLAGVIELYQATLDRSISSSPSPSPTRCSQGFMTGRRRLLAKRSRSERSDPARQGGLRRRGTFGKFRCDPRLAQAGAITDRKDSEKPPKKACASSPIACRHAASRALHAAGAGFLARRAEARRDRR